MNIVSWLQQLMSNFGAEWVMWLLVGLSVISVAVMLERSWFFMSLRDDIEKLAEELRKLLRQDDIDGAIARMRSSPSAEAAVVVAGLLESDRGPESARQAMNGAAALQRMKLERRLAYLGTLGNNAPFIGLFGTVIGVVQAFEALGAQSLVEAQQSSGMAPQEVMAAIAEALIATAVGLLVAIPAVAMFNTFQRRSKSILANTEALGGVLLAHLGAQQRPDSRGSQRRDESK
jgi:biopolymer transport protein ExbB/TolQ